MIDINYKGVLVANIEKPRSADTVPRWRVGNILQEFPYAAAVRVNHYEAQTISKRIRSVVPMTVKDYRQRFGCKPKIFIGRSQGIGDILMLTPALRQLHDEGWDITLAVMHQFLPVVERNPFLVRAVGCGPNEMPPTKIANRVNLNMKVEQAFKQFHVPRAELFARLVGVQVPEEKKHPILVLNDMDRQTAKLLMGRKKWIGIAVRTSTTSRNYPQPQELALLLAARGHNVVLVHHESNKKTGCVPEHENILDLQGKTTCGEMMAIVERCAAFISADSGPMHVALTLKTPCVCLEGPMPPRIYLSSYKQSPKTVMQKALPCVGCAHKGMFQQCLKYAKSLHECMKFPPIEVVGAVEKLMPKRKRRKTNDKRA